VLFVFSNILELTGYNADLEIQPISAQNGIKYVMAITCIIFMVFGFVMAKRYVLSREKNEQVQKFLAISREGEIDKLSAEESAEYLELKRTIS
jgi:Na+/melibiose symporter-like transporter